MKPVVKRVDVYVYGCVYAYVYGYVVGSVDGYVVGNRGILTSCMGIRFRARLDGARGAAVASQNIPLSEIKPSIYSVVSAVFPANFTLFSGTLSTAFLVVFGAMFHAGQL